MVEENRVESICRVRFSASWLGSCHHTASPRAATRNPQCEFRRTQLKSACTSALPGTPTRVEWREASKSDTHCKCAALATRPVRQPMPSNFTLPRNKGPLQITKHKIECERERADDNDPHNDG